MYAVQAFNSSLVISWMDVLFENQEQLYNFQTMDKDRYDVIKYSTAQLWGVIFNNNLKTLNAKQFDLIFMFLLLFENAAECHNIKMI